VPKAPAEDRYGGHVRFTTYYAPGILSRRVVSVRAWCTSCEGWDYTGSTAAMAHHQAAVHVGHAHGVVIPADSGKPSNASMRNASRISRTTVYRT
jgi:hypothetical protein